jgi:glycosyltransferase involved in cell wall biosynthesis
MKILQINSVCGIRSTGRICTDLADILAENGHECKIAYGREIVPENYRKYAVLIGNNFDVKIHALHSRIFDSAGFGSKKATKIFLEWVEAYDPDLIHLHNIHGYYINIELLFQYLKTCGKPIVWTLHDCWSFTGHCTHFDFAECNKWEKGCSNCPQQKEYPKSVLFDHSRKNYEIKRKLFTEIDNFSIVTPSNWLARIVSKSFLKNYPVEVIHNGIDTSIFRPTDSVFRKKYGLENKRIILGVASIWERRKGLEDFFKLSEKLDEKYKIVLVGLSDKQVHSLPANIIGITRTNDTHELAAIYTAADVFVNPSYEETMGLTTIEALACGTPVIVYNKTAVPEVVTEHCGIVLKKNSANAIKSTIDTLNFGAETCIKQAKNFDKKTKYEEYLNLYNGLYFNESIIFDKSSITVPR